MFEKLKRERVANQGGYSRTVFFTSLLSISMVRSLQNGEAPSAKLDNQVANQVAEYPGGALALFDYLGTTIRYPSVKYLGIKGKVMVQFLIDGHGEIDKVQVIRSLNDDCDDEARRLIKSPKWTRTPAVREGHPVKTQMLVPVMYKVG